MDYGRMGGSNPGIAKTVLVSMTSNGARPAPCPKQNRVSFEESQNGLKVKTTVQHYLVLMPSTWSHTSTPPFL
jgi:hypothetical protein